MDILRSEKYLMLIWVSLVVFLSFMPLSFIVRYPSRFCCLNVLVRVLACFESVFHLFPTRPVGMYHRQGRIGQDREHLEQISS